MAGQVFAYIKHANGVLDDSALELLTAAKKISDQPVTAIVTGSGVDNVCNEAAKAYSEVWKIDNDALSYPNAEIVRKALLDLLPTDAVVLFPHDTFGMDLAPGLSIKLDSAFVSDIVDIEAIEGDTMKVVRQEFSGQVNTHVSCDLSAGAVLNVRPGVYAADDPHAGAEQHRHPREVAELLLGLDAADLYLAVLAEREEQ